MLSFHVQPIKSHSTVKLTDMNIWSYVVTPEEVLRMSYGCGEVRGDVISWDKLTQSKSITKQLQKRQTCKIAKGGMSINATGTVYNSSLESPWLNRSGSHYGMCMKFRYIAYGLGSASLAVYQTVKGDDMGERPIWRKAVGMKKIWHYGQVSVGAVTRNKISIRSESQGGPFLLSVGGVEFSDGYCETEPEPATEACNVNLTASSGFITSPYYPGYYPNNAHCAWQVKVTAGQVIRLSLKAFQLEEQERCTGDYLEVHDGIPGVSKSSLIGRYCGDMYPPIIESTTNAVFIVFKTNGDVTRKGFKLYYETKENKNSAACAINQGDCPGGCRCYIPSGDKSRLIVEGDSLLAVPKNIPSHTSATMFSGNRIIQVKTGDFSLLRDLEFIDLSRNIILRIQDGGFGNLPSLKNIKLTSNFIQDLKFKTFASLGSLESLDIAENLLGNIDEQVFSSLRNLKSLSLRENKINVLHAGLFQNTTNLTYLYLQNNLIGEIPDGLFTSLGKLKVLFLDNNRIKKITLDTFKGLTSLESLTLDHFTLCCYAVTTIPSVDCKAPADEFSSCDDLMKNKTLQVCIWVLGILAFVGNIFVIVWRVTIRENNKIQSLLLTNLAISDFLMGLYLLIIAIKDAQWQGEYFKHDMEWRSGKLCQFAGSLSMISSEVSVLMLTMITLDRFMCIVFPMKFKRLTHKRAIFSCAFVWIFGCLISLIPLMGLSYFYDDQREIRFYGRSAVCLPLQLSSDRPAGWEYSVSFFIGLNFVAFMFILLAYVAMFWTVKKSSTAAGSSNAKKESALARKLLIIILTDFCCWMPVIIIGMLSLSGNFYDPQKLAYVWIAVFVLPVNSSINPILYTFSTVHVKKRITEYSHSMSGYKQNTLSSVGNNRNQTNFSELHASPRRTLKKSILPVLINKRVSPIENSTKITITGIADFLKSSSDGIGYVNCLVDTSMSEYLLKVFSSDHIKAFSREVEVLEKLHRTRDHENILSYRWHAKGDNLEVTSLNVKLSWLPDNEIDAKCRIICFANPTLCTKTLASFLQETNHSANMECLLVISVDILHGVEHLHKHGVTHDNITADTVLIRKCKRIPPIKACIGGFDSARVCSAKRSPKAYGNDVTMVGILLKHMLHSCGYSGNFSGKVRDVLEMCFTETCNWNQRISEIRQALEQAWSSSNEWDTSV